MVTRKAALESSLATATATTHTTACTARRVRVFRQRRLRPSLIFNLAWGRGVDPRTDIPPL